MITGSANYSKERIRIIDRFSFYYCFVIQCISAISELRIVSWYLIIAVRHFVQLELFAAEKSVSLQMVHLILGFTVNPKTWLLKAGSSIRNGSVT